MTGDELADKLASEVDRWTKAQARYGYDDMDDAEQVLMTLVRLNLPAILAHLRAESPEALERAAEAACERYHDPGAWAERCDAAKQYWRDIMRAALRAAVSP